MTSIVLILVGLNIAAILLAGSKYAVKHRAEQRYWREKYILDSAEGQLSSNAPASRPTPALEVGATYRVVS